MAVVQVIIDCICAYGQGVSLLPPCAPWSGMLQRRAPCWLSACCISLAFSNLERPVRELGVPVGNAIPAMQPAYERKSSAGCSIHAHRVAALMTSCSRRPGAAMGIDIQPPTHCSSVRWASSRFLPAYDSRCRAGIMPPLSCDAVQPRQSKRVRPTLIPPLCNCMLENTFNLHASLCASLPCCRRWAAPTHPDYPSQVLHTHLWADMQGEGPAMVLAVCTDLVAILIVCVLRQPQGMQCVFCQRTTSAILRCCFVLAFLVAHHSWQASVHMKQICLPGSLASEKQQHHPTWSYHHFTPLPKTLAPAR